MEKILQSIMFKTDYAGHYNVTFEKKVSFS
jgi:hypothetical protein